MKNISRFLFAIVLACLFVPALSAQSRYLPLASGDRWTLRNPSVPVPITIEVLDKSGDEYHIRFASPFGTNEWMLRPQGERYILTKYGGNGRLADLPADTVYFDFSARNGQSWSNTIGKLSVTGRDVTVRTRKESYEDCVRIKQGNNMSFTFAPGKGFVVFGEGKEAYVLAESESSLEQGGATQSAATSQPDDSLPASHVPGPPKPGSSSGARAPVEVPVHHGNGNVLFSITPNVFANQAQTPENLLAAFGMVEHAGMGFLVHNGKWNELEPKPGQYNLDPLDFNVSTAKRLNIPICYTLRIIETVDRAVPGDLKKMSWSDPRLEQRLLNLVQAMAPHFDGKVRWMLIGNEIDGYFARHPNELADYVKLYTDVAARLKQLSPGIRVSATLMFGGVDLMDGMMRPLTDKFDFICFTYYPIRGDFTMQDPQLVSRHVDRMRQAAHGRGLVLQEIGYSSGAKNSSNEEMQAQFVENVFKALRANSDFVEAGCFWLLADLKDDLVNNLSQYYGITNSAVFKSFLQTLGMYDGSGHPKKAWSIYTREIHATN